MFLSFKNINLQSYTLLVSLFIINNCVLIYCSNLEHDSHVNIRLYHSLTEGLNPVFTDRGNITIHSLRTGQAIVQQKPLTATEKEQLKSLSAKNGFYTLKSVVVGVDEEREFISTIKACMLAEAELDDRLSVSVDYMGKVIGVTIIIASKSTCEGADVPTSKLKEFTTNVYVRLTEVGPVPDTASFIQRLEREREGRAEVKDNRSFLAKYWMYIVPVVIIMLISSATNPEGGQGNQGGGQ